MATNNERLASWQRFMRAVREGRQGNYALARDIVEGVRERFGDAAAEAQRRELWRMINAGQPKTTEVAK